MSITVVTRRRARPGQAEALFALAAERMARHGTRGGARRESRLFQGLEDPHDLLRIAHWDGEQSYWAAMRALGSFEPLDALSKAPGDRLFFRRLALFEVLSRRIAMVDSVLIATPPEAGVAIRRHLLESGNPTVRALPGLALDALYVETEAPERLLVVHGWESAAALDRFLVEAAPDLAAALRDHGASVQRFVGRTRVEHDRYAPGDPPDADRGVPSG